MALYLCSTWTSSSRRICVYTWRVHSHIFLTDLPSTSEHIIIVKFWSVHVLLVNILSYCVPLNSLSSLSPVLQLWSLAALRIIVVSKGVRLPPSLVHHYYLPLLSLSPIRILVCVTVRLWSVDGPRTVKWITSLKNKRDTPPWCMTIETVEVGSLIIDHS